MKKSFFILAVALLFPLSNVQALYIPSEPIGSEHNPFFFQEIVPLDQKIWESQQRVRDAQKEADSALGNILRDAAAFQQGHTQNIPVYVPIVVPVRGSAPAQDASIASDSCPQNSHRFVEGGECLCGPGGYEWNEDKTICSFSVEKVNQSTYESICGRNSVWPGSMPTHTGDDRTTIKCTCKSGFTENQKPGVVGFSRCVPDKESVEYRQHSGSFWSWLKSLLGF